MNRNKFGNGGYVGALTKDGTKKVEDVGAIWTDQITSLFIYVSDS